jgi:hypothetical protein
MIIDQKARIFCDFIDMDQLTPGSAVAIETKWEFNPINYRENVPVGSRWSINSPGWGPQIRCKEVT